MKPTNHGAEDLDFIFAYEARELLVIIGPDRILHFNDFASFTDRVPSRSEASIKLTPMEYEALLVHDPSQGPDSEEEEEELTEEQKLEFEKSLSLFENIVGNAFFRISHRLRVPVYEEDRDEFCFAGLLHKPS